MGYGIFALCVLISLMAPLLCLFYGNGIIGLQIALQGIHFLNCGVIFGVALMLCIVIVGDVMSSGATWPVIKLILYPTYV